MEDVGQWLQEAGPVNRFFRVWASSLNVRTVIGLLAMAAIVLAAFFMTENPLVIGLAAMAFAVGIVVYNRSRNSGIEGSLISDPNLTENRYLSFQISCGMSRDEYVDSYLAASLFILPPIFAILLVMFYTHIGEIGTALCCAWEMTAMVLLLIMMVVHHNIGVLSGHDDAVRFILMLLLFIALFFGILVVQITLWGAPYWGTIILTILACAGAIYFRMRAIKCMRKADI
jgi:hypothetical protein